MPVRSTTFSGLLLLVLLTLSEAVGALEPGPAQVGRVSAVEGNVQISYGEDAEAWDPATVNYPVAPGARVAVDASARAEIRIGPSAIRLDGQALLDVIALEQRLARFRLDEGAMNLALRDVLTGEGIEVATPWALVTIRAPGSYRIDADPVAESTRIAVRAGEALVNSDAGENLLKAGQSLAVTATGFIEYHGGTGYDLDEFDRWSHALEAERADLSSGEMPQAITGYEELDQNGTWSTYSGYGPVWTPGAVYDWWTPYSYGHWAWVPPWGWTWVDQAPWAFATFRFGRWVFLDHRWWWAPGAVWPRPALTAFVPFHPGQIIFTTSFFVHGKPAHHFVPLKPKKLHAAKRPWHPHAWRKADGHAHHRHRSGQWPPAAGAAIENATPPAASLRAIAPAATATLPGAGSIRAVPQGANRFAGGTAVSPRRGPRPALTEATPAPAGVVGGTATGSVAAPDSAAAGRGARTFPRGGGRMAMPSNGLADPAATPAQQPPEPVSAPSAAETSVAPEPAAVSPRAVRIFPRQFRGGSPVMPSVPAAMLRQPSGTATAPPAGPPVRIDAEPRRGGNRHGHRGARTSAESGNPEPSLPGGAISGRTPSVPSAVGGGAVLQGEASQARGGGRRGHGAWQGGGRSRGASSGVPNPMRPAAGFRPGAGLRR